MPQHRTRRPQRHGNPPRQPSRANRSIRVVRDAVIVRNFEIRDRHLAKELSTLEPAAVEGYLRRIVQRGFELDRDGWLTQQFQHCAITLNLAVAALDHLRNELGALSGNGASQLDLDRLAPLSATLDTRIDELQTGLRTIAAWGYVK